MQPYTPQVVLPPYTPSSSTSPVIGAVEPNPQQNLPYLVSVFASVGNVCCVCWSTCEKMRL